MIILILLMFLIIFIYREIFYLQPSYIIKDCSDFITHYNIIKYNYHDLPLWFIPNKQSNKIIIFLQGYSKNITWTTRILSMLSDNFNVPIYSLDYLMINNLSINNIINKCSQFINSLTNKYDKKNIILIGESLGCALSLNIAQKLSLKHIICIVGFRNMSDIVKKKLYFFGNIISPCITELNNELLIKNNNFNVTLLNSVDDDLVNYDDVKIMALNTNTELLTIYGKHNRYTINNSIFNLLKIKYQIH
jgi:hypothetical protein